MARFLFVALGGALGAVIRYAIGLLPNHTEFPYLTLLINLTGAVGIGFVAGLSGNRELSGNWKLFWKTGVCGGFTTFSALSLESVELFRQGKTGLGVIYIATSLFFCLLGVLAGQYLARRFSSAG